MSSKILYLYDNLLDSATLTASSELVGFPANNLKNPFRTKVWRTEGANPGVATLVIDHGSAKTVDAIALTGYTWATAPGRLVVEFSDSNSWDTPAAVETLTWHSPTTPGGNKGSIILKLSTARTYRYNRLRVAAQSVTLTAAESGSGIIGVADSDHIDFGTGNFSLVWRGSLPDWPPSAYVSFISKLVDAGGGNLIGYHVRLMTTGKLDFVMHRTDPGTVFTSTAALSIADGAVHEICISVTRETASTAGSVKFFVDGVQIGNIVAITAAATASISNSTSLYFRGCGTTGIAGTVQFFATYNRALSAADALALYQNGIAYADKWGAQTAKYTSDFSAGVDSWTAAQGAVAGNIDAIGGENDWLRYTVNNVNAVHYIIHPNIFTAGKKYRITGKYFIPSTNSIMTRIYIAGGSAYTIILNEASPTLDTVISFSVEVTIAGAGGMLILGHDSKAFQDAGGDDVFYVKDIVITEIGATLALEPEGITSTDWQDSSSNNLDGTYPVAGCTVNGAADWDLGRLFVGEYFEPTHNYSWGYEEGIVDPSLISSTIGGQDHADEIEHYRTVRASGVMSAQAQWVDYQMMINTVGVRKPLWIAFDYDSETEERTIYGKFTTPPAITRPYLFNWSFEFKEDR